MNAGIRLSPTAEHVAVMLGDASEGGLNVDIWVIDLVRGTSQRMTSAAEMDRFPVWSPAGDRIAFVCSDKTTGIRVINPNGRGLRQLVPLHAAPDHALELDASGHVVSEQRVLRRTDAKAREAHHVRHPRHQVPDALVDARRNYAHQHLTVIRDRLGGVSNP